MISSFLHDFAGGQGKTLYAVLLTILIFLGTGNLLRQTLRIRISDGMERFCVDISLGFSISALFFFFGSLHPTALYLLSLLLKITGMCGSWGAFTESQYLSGLFQAKTWKKIHWSAYVIGGLLLAFSINAFQYPASWDECVYQLAIPVRWVHDGCHSCFYEDLPYSGFPLLPQFVWMFLIANGGVAAAKFMMYLMTAAFIVQLYCLAAGNRRHFLGGLFVISVLLSPIMLHVVSAGYAEPVQGCLMSSALLLLMHAKCKARDEQDEKKFPRHLLALLGILAGANAAFKLTGCMISFSIFCMLFLFRPAIAKEKKNFFTFVLFAFFMAAPFYLRPWILTKNPCYPYLSEIFSVPSHVVSYYHYSLGTAKFAKISFITSLVLLPGLIFPNFSSMFDGSYGLTFLIWILPPVITIAVLWTHRHFKQKQRIAFLLSTCILLGFMVVVWFSTSPQARFLLPYLTLMAILLRFSMFGIKHPEKKLAFAFLVVLLMFSSIPITYGMTLLKNWKHTWSGADAKRDLLYARTGNSMLVFSELLQKEPLRSVPGKCLLVGEERTLYFPTERCLIATPFFQDKFFPDGFIPNKDVFLKEMKEHGFSMVYFCDAENNPDMQPEFQLLWKDELQNVLNELVNDKQMQVYQIQGNTTLYVLTQFIQQ